MFLGIGASVGGWNAASTECVISLDENPFAEFVELPERCRSRTLFTLFFLLPFSQKRDRKRNESPNGAERPNGFLFPSLCPS